MILLPALWKLQISQHYKYGSFTTWLQQESNFKLHSTAKIIINNEPKHEKEWKLKTKNEEKPIIQQNVLLETNQIPGNHILEESNKQLDIKLNLKSRTQTSKYMIYWTNPNKMKK